MIHVVVDLGANQAVRSDDEHGCRRRVSSARLGVLLFLSLALTKAAVPAEVPGGVWLMRSAAVQIFGCNGLLCGRIVWLQHPRDTAGQLVRDKKNPDPALRERPLCGQTILWGLQPTDSDLWGNGWLYNPDDGKTYRARAELRSADTIVARIYRGVPFIGETLTLLRVPRLSSEGWC